MKRVLAISLAMTALWASAQQTVFESNLLTGAKVMTDGASVNDISHLTDGDDTTMATITNSGNGMAIVYTFDDPVFVTAINIVAGYDTSLAPLRLYVYGRNSEGESWSNVARLMTVSFPLPNTNYVGKAMSTSKSFKEYKVEINSVRNGGNTAEIAELQFLGRDGNLPVISTVENGSYSNSAGPVNYGGYGSSLSVAKDSYDNGVLDDDAWRGWLQYDFDSPTAISGYTLGGSGTGAKKNRPAVWELLASNDGENWLTLDMQSNSPDTDAEQFAVEYTLGKSGLNIDFAAACDGIYDMIQNKFWSTYGGGNYLIQVWSTDPEKTNNFCNYWWMAHAVDAYLDAYIRTGKPLYETKARQIRQALYKGYWNRNDLWTDYFDDMAWMCLACLRAYKSVGVMPTTWLNDAKALFDWIWNDGHSDKYGAVKWNYNRNADELGSYNSCSNGPTMIAAGMLYEITGEQHYLDKAISIFNFMVEHNLFDDGFVMDSPTEPNREWAFTYNQGTWVGGLLELYKATNDKKYYDIAVDLMDKSIDSRWYSPNGILCESGKGDGGLFKGIYVRYITEWVLSGLLDENRQTRYANYLVENARSLYLAALLKPEMTVMANWQDRGEASLEEYNSSVLLSGLFLFEGVDKLRKAGLLNDDYSVKLPYEETAFKHYRLNVSENFKGNLVEITSFALLGESTGDSGVENIEADNLPADDNWYTLTGMKVINPAAPGIYIHNGKKIIINK